MKSQAFANTAGKSNEDIFENNSKKTQQKENIGIKTHEE